MLWTICSSLARAPSLEALHLSGNPGISEELLKQVGRRIKAKKRRLERHITLNNGMDEKIPLHSLDHATI